MTKHNCSLFWALSSAHRPSEGAGLDGCDLPYLILSSLQLQLIGPGTAHDVREARLSW